MTLPVPVHAPVGPYSAAVAELPVTTRPSDVQRGAIVVVSRNESWPDAVRAAITSGAAAIVLADPCVTGYSAMRALARDVTVPVIVERPRLRGDAIRKATATRVEDGAVLWPNVVTVECEAPTELLAAVVRDAVGWLRVLSNATVAMSSSLVLETAGLALLESPRRAGAGLSMPLRWTAGGPSVDGWIRVNALGEQRTEIVVDGARATVAFENAGGRTIAPRSREGSPRLALRRAVQALSEAEVPTDLTELAADVELAHRILSRRP